MACVEWEIPVLCAASPVYSVGLRIRGLVYDGKYLCFLCLEPCESWRSTICPVGGGECLFYAHLPGTERKAIP